MQIAVQQKKEIDAMREILTGIEQIAGPSARDGFADLRSRLDTWAARVAVIGQVKAGKSTFLNAFLGQHDFLPSDVNPWTSVVTNLRVNLPDDPLSGAAFEFFDEASWEEIINGDTQLRKLTERVLPGFDAGLLRQQTNEMKDRAQRRLGKFYHTLLGTTHAYDFVTPELLQRYVCAGDSTSPGANRAAQGRYAAITKVANLYFRRPDFAVPTIITDTPGVNDPFLVRDEFTCRSLDRSDVFIVVLSAHQALTDVDVALMRILAHQDAKDLVIFVNRIDELDDYDVDVDRVVGDVAKRLASALPGTHFSIHAGSAYFADLALRDDADAIAIRNRLDDAHLARYLRATQGHVPPDQRDRFLAASGVDDVKRTLSTVIDHGIGSRQIGQLAADLRAEVGGLLFVCKRERDSVQMQVEKIGANQSIEAFNAVQDELDQLNATRDQIDQNYDAATGQIDRIVSRSWAALEKALNDAITGFIDDQRARVKDRVLRKSLTSGGGTLLQVDLMPLREVLEERVGAHFAKARAGIDVVLSNGMMSCRSIIDQKFAMPGDGFTLDGLPHDQFASTLVLSKKKLEIGLVNSASWAFWQRREFDIEKTLDALRIIAVAELRPAIQKILKAYNEAQVERAVAGQGRLQVVQRMVDSAIDERAGRLKSDRAQIEQVQASPEAVKRMVHRLHSQLEVLERRIQLLSISEGTLAKTTLAHAA